MQPMDPKQLSSAGKRFFELIEFDDNERLIAEIRKHPFGLFLVYLTGFFVSGAILAVIIFIISILSREASSNFGQLRPWILTAAVILVALSLIITFIGAMLYRSNVIFVTSEKIAQVVYLSLFNRKISQLSVGDVQDVTVKQNGVLPRLFNYGTIVIETAGEQQNYTFSFVPDPYQNSKKIVYAHEENLKLYGN